jgi:hypothetical protein
MSGSGAPKADKSARLYALRDGLSQISWLCAVLEEYAKLEKEMLGAEYTVAMNRHYEILREIQDQMSTRYTGRYAWADAYKCFAVLLRDMRTWAATHLNPNPGQVAWVEDEWGMQFLELLDGFNEILDGAIMNFLESRKVATILGPRWITQDLDRFRASTTEMEDKLAALLRFVYDWKSKMTSSPNKQRIQGDDAWTNLCYQCVWITTSFRQPGNSGALGALYADCIAQKEVLNRDVQAYVLEGALDDKHETYNRRDEKAAGAAGAAGAAAGAKTAQTAKKARRGEWSRPTWRSVQMTALLGDLQKLCV